jgi:hypothetical protein
MVMKTAQEGLRTSSTPSNTNLSTYRSAVTIREKYITGENHNRQNISKTGGIPIQ